MKRAIHRRTQSDCPHSLAGRALSDENGRGLGEVRKSTCEIGSGSDENGWKTSRMLSGTSWSR